MSQDHDHGGLTEHERDAMRREQNLIEVMGERLDAMWWLDRHMAEGGWTPRLDRTWRRLRDEENRAVEQMKVLMVSRTHADCGAA